MKEKEKMLKLIRKKKKKNNKDIWKKILNEGLEGI